MRPKALVPCQVFIVVLTGKVPWAAEPFWSTERRFSVFGASVEGFWGEVARRAGAFCGHGA